MSNRKEAELAVKEGNTIHDQPITISWYEPTTELEKPI